MEVPGTEVPILLEKAHPFAAIYQDWLNAIFTRYAVFSYVSKSLIFAQTLTDT